MNLVKDGPKRRPLLCIVLRLRPLLNASLPPFQNEIPAPANSSAIVGIRGPLGFRSLPLLRLAQVHWRATLRPGDLVTTLEHGPKPVRWIASSELVDDATPLPDSIMPVRIKPGTMGNRLPLVVSPQHCILMTDEQKGGKIYVRAKHLAEETRLASFARGRKCVTYVHVLLDQHATLISNGIPSESSYPGPMALETLSVINRITLHSLIPGLTLKSVDEVYGPRAAPVLKRREVRKMAANGRLVGFHADFAAA